MIEQAFYDGIVVGGTADFDSIIETLHEMGLDWCVIGNFAINAYSKPVYTAELELVVPAAALDEILRNLRVRGFRVRSLPDFTLSRRQSGPFVWGTYRSRPN